MRAPPKGVVHSREQRLWFFPHQVSRGRNVADWGRSRRAALMVGLGPVVMWTAACASSTATIPSATPSPSAASTTIAPGVSVNPSELALPPYSVSTSNPLPADVSAKQVVSDVIVDDLIENVAVVKAAPGLLIYSDSGGVLALDRNQIATDESSGIRVISVEDSVSSMQLGAQADPDNPAALIAVVVQGIETMRERSGSHRPHTTVENFKVLVWVVWSTEHGRYLQCDVSTLS